MSHPVELLSAFLDGELDADARAGVEAHLAQCPACTARLDDFTAVDAIVRRRLVDAPAGYFEALPSRVRDRIRGRRQRRPPVWAWAAAAGILLAVLTPLTIQLRRPAPILGPAPGTVAPAMSASTPPAPSPESAGEAAALPPAAVRPQAAKAPAEARKDEAGPRNEPARQRAMATEPPVSEPAVAGRLAQAPAERPLPAPGAPASSERPAAPAVTTNEVSPPAGMPDKALPSTAKTADLEEGKTARSRLEEREHAEAEADTVSRGLRGGTAARRIETPDEGELRTAEEARRLRETWRAAAAHEASPAEADEARVRAIEAGIRAWRLGADPKDLARAREDARVYLARKDARQPDRVRAALRLLPSP
jgi:hypothetical protein